MGSVRALQKRVGRLERAGKARPSPIVILFGTFDRFVEVLVLPGIEAGQLSRSDMVEVVAALRVWEADGTWDKASSD